MNDQFLSEAVAVMKSAECVYDQLAVEDALNSMAARISRDLEDKNPIVICVMNGGLVPAGLLLTKLAFPLKVDYLHATRYREGTSGKELIWQRSPAQPLNGQHVLIIDDILDEGHTLAAIIDYCQAQAPASLQTAVLAKKEHERGVRPPLEYIGLKVPDKYVFGCGMDYKGYWRNLPGIYAVS